MNDAASLPGYQEFLAVHGALIDRLAAAGRTQREAAFRILLLYPEVDPQFVEHALSERGWEFPEVAEEPLSGVVVAMSVWLAVNELFALGVDRQAAAADLDAAILQEVAGFLDLSQVPPREASELQGRIGATMRFLTAYPHTTLSATEYREFRSRVPGYLRGLSMRRAGAWPVSEQTFAQCFGDGDWSRALLAVGLAPEERYTASGRDRNPEFTESRFRSALADFLTWCIRNDRRPEAILYGRWSSDTEHQTAPRPSLAAIRHVYGSWSAALANGRALINSTDPQQGDPRFQEHWVSPWAGGEMPADGDAWTAQSWTDRGIGVVEQAAHEAVGDESAWADLEAEIAEALQDLPWNHFLNIEYETGNTGGNLPYVQAFTGPAGVSLSLVSETFLPAIAWPIDDEHLLETGWTAPTERHPHWERERLDTETAAHAAVDGLRYGRDCTDPYRFRWGSGAIYQQSGGHSPAAEAHQS